MTGAGAERVTMRDVASVAGVSTATVSKVINDRPDVGAEVRQRVLDTIARLGYRPNAVARGLRARHTDTIAILTDDLEGIFTNALMRGVEDAASAFDVSTAFIAARSSAAREKLEARTTALNTRRSAGSRSLFMIRAYSFHAMCHCRWTVGTPTMAAIPRNVPLARRGTPFPLSFSGPLHVPRSQNRSHRRRRHRQ